MSGEHPTKDAAGLTRREALVSAAAAGLVLAGVGEAVAAVPGKMQITGPIPTTATSKPFGTAVVPGTSAFELLKKYDLR